MNLQVQLQQGSSPRRLKLTADQFWRLKQAGVFSRYGKSELLEGELSGVPLQMDGEPESDASMIPIKLRVQDYVLLDEAGLLPGDRRTELVDGLLYEMSPQHRPHWYAKNELTYRLRRALEEIGSALYVGSEGSVLLTEFDLPEPDVILTDEPIGTGPIPVASVRLLVEITNSSHELDFGAKAALYARHGVPEYWVVDLSAQAIRQMWEPASEAYSQRREVGIGERIVAATIERLAMDSTGLG